MPAMRVAVYARFSSDLQRATSIDDQIATAHRYAVTHGWQVLDDHVYTDAAISGASLERPGIQALRTATARRPLPFDLLLVDDSSRVSRDLADAVRLLQELKFNGVRVIYISQNIDSANEQAETLIAVHGVVDSLYLREMSKKVKRGLVGQLERGFATGSSTYGYRTLPVLDPSGKKDAHGRPAVLGNRIEIDPDEARVVVQIFEWYASGLGTLRIVERLHATNWPGPRGGSWKAGAVKRLLANEKFTGKWIWGQKVFERRPGTHQHIVRAVPRDQWHVRDSPELRIVDDALWRRVEARRSQVRESLPVSPDGRRTLMRGRNGALHSKHLFVGFLRCGGCVGAITVIYGRPGEVRYGCSRSHRNGLAACDNRLTVREQVVDRHLLAGLRAALLHSETVRYITAELTRALNRLMDERPRLEAEVRAARDQAAQRLHRLIAAIENGVAANTLAAAISERQADLARLEAQLEDFTEPLHQRLAVIPGWVEHQLRELSGLLGAAPERVKLEFQRLGLEVVMQPVQSEGSRPFYRAMGKAALPCLAGTRDLSSQIVDRSLR
jgi:site-specific DNA recombinase